MHWRLRQADRDKADQGTLLAERTWDLAHQLGAFFLGEFPEDLGATDAGVPASLWQMQQFQDFLAVPNVKTFAFFQYQFDAQTPKPTRFITDLEHWEAKIYLGVPQFDKDWRRFWSVQPGPGGTRL